MVYVRETVKQHHHHHQNSSSLSSLPIKLETAYDILQPYRLSFDIAPIDKCLDLTDRGGGSGGTSSLCVTSNCKDVSNTLLTRLCIRALMSRRQGGFETLSPLQKQ
jgi:hypothetical protein